MERQHDGYFTPDDTIWRVARELALMLGGGRALLLQVAHPLVAAGVAQHSSYREDPWKRLEGTMKAVWAVVYGSRTEADRWCGARGGSHHDLAPPMEAGSAAPSGAPTWTASRSRCTTVADHG